jgi:hypothetical protein
MLSRIKNAVCFIKARPLLQLVIMTTAAFSPILRHGFVGDDLAFIVYNRFYDSPANVLHLLDEKYLTHSHDILFGNTVNFSSGSVAYRPVLSATFFIDRWIWSRRPFGYHLHNLILHVVNVVLVFMLIVQLSRNPSAAFFGTALFALHPTKAEPVSVVGYRADLLSGLFLLGAFLSVVYAQRGRPKSHPGFWVFSLGLYALALFTKESALAFPLLLAGYFLFLKSARPMVRSVPVFYAAGTALVTGFYLSVYFFVFPNTTLPQLNIRRPWGLHLVRVLEIFCFNIKELFCPWSVKIVPGLYQLPLDAGSVVNAGMGILIMFLLISALIRNSRSQPASGFFIFWFLAAYLPISHLIPLVNPVAHRYLYVPSVGLLAGVVLWGEEFLMNNRIFNIWPRWRLIGKSGIVLMCVLKLGILNSAWKNDLVLAKALIKTYPHHRAGYQSLGMLAFQQRDCPTAVWALQESIMLGARDPRVFTFLGYCLMEEPGKAEFFFREAIKEYPRFHLPYKGIGEIMLRKGDFGQALFYLRENMRLLKTPRASDYDLLITVYQALGEVEEARKITSERESKFPNGGRNF